METAEACGRSPRAVSTVLKKAGVPTRGRGGSAKPAPVQRPDLREAYDELGDPPDDALEAEVWAHSACATMARQIMTDEKYEGKESERRKELRDTFAMMTKLVPRARLRKAEKVIRGDEDSLTNDQGAEYDEAEDQPGPRIRSKAIRE